MSGSSEAATINLAEKNRIKSLQDHTEPLKEELGLASIAGPRCEILWPSSLIKEIAEAFCGPWDSNVSSWYIWVSLNWRKSMTTRLLYRCQWLESVTVTLRIQMCLQLTSKDSKAGWAMRWWYVAGRSRPGVRQQRTPDRRSSIAVERWNVRQK